MAKRFVVCPACSRHVRETDGACPFCRGPAPASQAARLAAPALAALVIGAAAGCAYGPPPEDPDDAGLDDAATDTQTVDRVASDVDLGG